MNLNKEQLHTLRHMLGINTPDDRVPKPYRNYAAVTPGNLKYIELEQLGAIKKYRTHDSHSQYDWYGCTLEGRLAAIKSHKTIRKTRAQRRYTAYLDMTDVYPELTFKDFLTHPDFSTARRLA